MMETTVTAKNMVSIPKSIAKVLEIRPGWKLDWRQGDMPDDVIVRVIPDRAEMARRMYGKGRDFAKDRDVIAELVNEREHEG